MKKIIISVFLASIALFSNAQHCPFDGSTVIVIKITGKNGKVKKLKSPVQLIEKDNPEADSCSFSKGLQEKNFADARTAIMNRHNGAWKSWAAKYSNCQMFKAGSYAIVLSMDESDCMIKQGNDYRYRERKYVIRYTPPGSQKPVELPVTKENMHSLCTNGGSWCRIKPLEIII